MMFGNSSQNRKMEVVAKAVLGMFSAAKQHGDLSVKLEGMDEATKAKAMEEFAEKMKANFFNLMATGECFQPCPEGAATPRRVELCG